MSAGARIVERVAVIDNVRTRTLEVAGSGPSVLLLHGFSDSADSWRPVLDQLAAMSRRAVAVDLPGSGCAPALERPALRSLYGFTEHFVRDYADDGPVVLAGNSLGGLLALRAAQDATLPLAAVAGIGPAGLAYHRRLVALEWMLRRAHPALTLLDRLPVPAPVVRRLAAVLYERRLSQGLADPALAAHYGSHFAGFGDLGRLRADLIALSADNRADPLSVGEIAVPVLLIWGKLDRLAALSGADAVLDAVSDSRLVVFDDCGHCPQIQRPVDVARLLADLPASLELDHQKGTP